MNEPTSWDPTLIKKFSSSNHYKLLNQLKNEVKKYPLNNKKQTSSIKSKDDSQVRINKSNSSPSQNVTLSNNPSYNSQLDSNKSTVSFNNAKNFSIYNNNNLTRKDESLFTDQSKSNEDQSSPTFKDRLNQIDMK